MYTFLVIILFGDFMSETNQKIIDVINAIKPFLNSEGGDIQFIKYEDNYVYVKLLGACTNCEYSSFDLNGSILDAIKDEVPEVKGVINVEI
jgi:Fe-S cluster biogenesis protein NfuA